jgi:hypothetical protein
MSNNLFSTSSEFSEAASQIQGGQPIFDFSLISESFDDSSCSQPINLDNTQQPNL